MVFEQKLLKIQLSAFGEIANAEILDLEKRYNIKIDKFAIMPNHIHAIIIIENESAGASPRPTLSDIICAFKSLTTRKCHLIKPQKIIWQKSFYDHIIRGEKDYLEIWEYIENNPQKWKEDKFYTE